MMLFTPWLVPWEYKLQTFAVLHCIFSFMALGKECWVRKGRPWASVIPDAHGTLMGERHKT